MRLNPFKSYSFNKNSIARNDGQYSYFVLTGLKDIQAKEGVIQALNSLNIDYQFSLFISRPNETTALEAVEKRLKSLDYMMTEDTGEARGWIDGLFGLPVAMARRVKQQLGGESQRKLEKEALEALELEELVDTRQENLYNFSLVLRLNVSDVPDVQKFLNQVERVFERYNVNLPAGYYIQDKLYEISTLQKQIPNEFRFKTTIDNIAAFDPFWLSVTTITENSILIGTTIQGDVLQFADYAIRVTVANHMIVTGSTGSGKSAFCKTLLWQMYRRGYKIIVLDPHGEYAPICEAMNCSTLDLSNQKGINAFDLSQYSSLMTITSITKSLIEAISLTTLSERQIGILNSLLHQAQESESDDKYSVFLDLLKDSKELRVFEKALSRENLVKLITDKDSKYDLSSQVIRVSFKNISDAELKLFVSIVVQVIGHSMSDPDKPTFMLVDEGSKFLKTGNGTDKIVQSWFQEMRKMNTAVCLVSQSLEEYGITAKIIWENSQHKFSFNQKECERVTLDDGLWERISHLAPYQMCYSYRENNGLEQNVFVKTIVPENLKQYVGN